MRFRKLITVLIILVLIYIVAGRLNIGGESIFSSNDESYIIPGTLTRDFSFLDYSRYLAYQADSFFSEWPIIVCLSLLIALSSTLALLCIVIRIIFRARKMARWNKRAENILKNFVPKCLDILSSKTNYTVEQIRAMLNLPRYAYVKSILDAEIIHKAYTENIFIPNKRYNRHNFLNIIEVFKLVPYFEQLLKQGKVEEQIFALRTMVVMELPINESYVSRLVNHKNIALKRIARIYFRLVDREDPYAGGEWLEMSLWDKILLHQTTAASLRTMGRTAPFETLLVHSKYISNAAFYIEEIGYWRPEETVEKLIPYIGSDEDRIVRAAVKVMARRRIKKAVPKILETYSHQSDHTCRLMLRALCIIHDGDQEDFFISAFRHTGSFRTKRVAVFSLYTYSEKGKQKFEELKRENTADDYQKIFSHVLATYKHSDSYLNPGNENTETQKMQHYVTSNL